VQTPCRDCYSPGNVVEKGDPALRALLCAGRSADWAEEKFLEGNGNIQGRLPYIAGLNHSDCMTNPTQPDITFFHEPAPRVFHAQIAKDIPLADLLIVIGTSLLIPPVKDIPGIFEHVSLVQKESADFDDDDRSSTGSAKHCHQSGSHSGNGRCCQ
jgi:NAD-dependent SIR2 family protein deacetylase